MKRHPSNPFSVVSQMPRRSILASGLALAVTGSLPSPASARMIDQKTHRLVTDPENVWAMLEAMRSVRIGKGKIVYVTMSSTCPFCIARYRLNGIRPVPGIEFRYLPHARGEDESWAAATLLNSPSAEMYQKFMEGKLVSSRIIAAEIDHYKRWMDSRNWRLDLNDNLGFTENFRRQQYGLRYINIQFANDIYPHEKDIPTPMWWENSFAGTPTFYWRGDDSGSVYRRTGAMSDPQLLQVLKSLR
jgi:hypothetical protein